MACATLKKSKLRFINIKFKYIIKHNRDMGFKTITIKENVYEKLMKAKGKDESFSDFLGKVVEEKKPDLMKFAGAWKDMPDEEFDRVKKAMKEFRESFDKDWEQRSKRHKQ